MKKQILIKPFNFVAKDLVTSKKYKMRVVRKKTAYRRTPKHKGVAHV